MSLTWKSAGLMAFLCTLGAAALGPRFVLWDVVASAAFSAVCISVGVRRFKPANKKAWACLFAASVTFFIGNLMRAIWPEAHPINAAPAIPDYLDVFAFFFAAISTDQFGRVRDGDKDPTTIIDALILTGGVSAVVWIGFLLPAIHQSDLPASTRFLGVAIATLTLWLVFIAAKLALGPGLKTAAIRPLAGAALCGMICQVAQSAGSGTYGTVTLTFGALSLVSLCIAALHPSMVRLTEPATQEIGKMTLRRLLMMTVAVLAAPAILLVKASSNGTDVAFYGGLIGSWTVVTCLVMVRLGGLVRARERVAETERVLSRAAAALVSTTDREETYEAAIVGMRDLAGESAEKLRVSVVLAFESKWVVEGSWGYGAEVAQGRQLDSLLMESTTASGAVQLNDTLAPDNPQAGRCSMIAAPLISHGQVRGGLIISTAKPLPSFAVDAYGSLASDLSLAIETLALSEDLHRRRSEQRFRALVENSADMIMVIADDGEITFASAAAERVLDGNDHLNHLMSLVYVEDMETVKSLIADAERHGHNARPQEFRILDKGVERWFEATATDLKGETEVAGVVLNAHETTERKIAERERDATDARFRSLVQHSSDLTAVLDINGLLTYVSPSAESILGQRPEALIGTDLSAILHPEDTSVIRELAGLLIHDTNRTKRFELRVRSLKEEWKTLDVKLTDLRMEPSVNGFVMNAHDITDRKLLENDLLHKVLHDDLTGIPNRVLFRDRVEHALKGRNSETETVTAALFIDVDDFKTVNDGLGHDVGDELLKVIAFRMESFVRSGDTAARLGGDEFAILIENLYTIEDVLNASHRLLQILNQPIEFGRREINVSASIGVALAEDDMTSEVLLRNADVAMYHAKQTGKNRVKLFDQEMYLSAFERLEFKADLVHALERKELSLHYQPLVSMIDGKVVGFEALMRWTHPSRGFVGPTSFIPLVEETGLIVPIGAWALVEAMTQLRAWRNKYGVQVGVSINVSPRQLEEENIVQVVEHALNTSGADPSWITLELTESAGLDDAAARDRLIGLRQLGCEIAADDFGTGFASYAALQKLPFTNVKIDRSLIMGLSAADAKAHAQVRSIIQMGHALGLTITAEGIEDSRQADALTVLGADKGQGYFYGRPVPAHEAEEHLSNLARLT